MSIDYANQRSYLDDLFTVYPTIPDGIHKINPKIWDDVEKSFVKQDNVALVEASSNEGDLVLDCFAGSETTLVAAQSLNRNWIGIDESESAIKVIRKRMKNLPNSLSSMVEYEFLKKKGG